MSVASFLAEPHTTAFSFEVLPPLRGRSIEQLFASIDRLMPFNPAYINITTHRTEGVYRQISDGVFQRTAQRTRPGSVAVAAALKGRYGIPTVPHVICSGFTRAELENELIDLSYLGITDLLVLRGDRARGENRFIPTEGGHEHAVQLCRQVEEFNGGRMIDGEEFTPLEHPFTFGVAGYPEKHDEAMNLDTDIEYLKAKIDAGARYVVTQMFFDNRKYFDFVRRCREAGIAVPIIPGIKPLSTLRHLTLLPQTFGCRIPEELEREVLRHREDPKAIREVGTEWAVAQSRELKQAGVPVLHYYPMGKADNIIKIAKAIF